MAAVHGFSKEVTNVKSEVSGSAPAIIHGMVLLNTTAAKAYLQMFTLATADVTVGTTVPNYVVPVAASGGVTISFPNHGWFLGGTGLVVAATTERGNAVSAPIETLILF